jgi:hypothetical protein
VKKRVRNLADRHFSCGFRHVGNATLALWCPVGTKSKACAEPPNLGHQCPILPNTRFPRAREPLNQLRNDTKVKHLSRLRGASKKRVGRAAYPLTPAVSDMSETQVDDRPLDLAPRVKTPGNRNLATSSHSVLASDRVAYPVLLATPPTLKM